MVRIYPYEVAASAWIDPQTMFEPDPDIRNHIFQDEAPWIVGFGIGVANSLWNLKGKGRPLYAGLPMTILQGVVMSVICGGGKHMHNLYCSKRDRMYRHYIQLHPEDFPKAERRKLSHKWDRWTPYR